MDTPKDISIPENWVSTTLGDIRLEKKQSIVPNKTPDQMFELYSVPNFVLDKPEIILGTEIGSNKQVVEEDTVLLCKINPRINRVWIVSNFSSYKKIASTEWIPFSKLDGVLPKYLCYFMQNNIFRDFLTLNVSGVGGSLMRIKAPTITGYPFPLPPLAEQHRIVARIEQLFTNLDAGVESLKVARTQLKRYRQSVLKSACEGRLVPTEAELARAEGREYEPAEVLLERILEERRRKWEELNKGKKKYKEPAAPDLSGLPESPNGWLGATIEQLNPHNRTCAYGVLQPGSNVKTGVLLVRVGNIKDGRIDTDGMKKISPSIAEKYSRTRLEGGEVLITLVGAIGRTAVVPQLLAGANTARAVGVIPLNENTDAPWVNIWFQRDEKIAEMTAKAHEVARKTLNLEDVRTTFIYLPPLAEQHRIVAEVERRLSVADEMEKTIEQSLKQTERLRQSILKRAFEGKLVPQNPEDELAGVLLERIKEEKAKREAEEKEKKRRITRKIEMMEVIKETKVEGLYEILQSSKKPMTPKELWQLSKLDIEEFYAQLKIEVEKGRVIENRPNDSDVYLEIGE